MGGLEDQRGCAPYSRNRFNRRRVRKDRGYRCFSDRTRSQQNRWKRQLSKRVGPIMCFQSDGSKTRHCGARDIEYSSVYFTYMFSWWLSLPGAPSPVGPPSDFTVYIMYGMKRT